MLHILFVCTGNTCRSPMAEALLRNIKSKLNPPFEIEVFSAGISSLPGEKVADEVTKLLRLEGIDDLKERCSVQLNQALVDEADLILVMTDNHLEQLYALYPQATEKTFKLAAYAECAGGNDIDDPIGQGEEKYRRVLEDIRACLKNLIFKLREMYGNENSNWQ